MEKNKIQKVNEPIVYLSGVTSLGVIGDPGCEGLGTYNMKVYAGALEKTSEDDITLIAGDLVPAGEGEGYEVRDFCAFAALWYGWFEVVVESEDE